MGLIVLFLASARIRGRRRMDERALAVLKAMRDPDRLKELLAETDRWLLEEEIAALSARPKVEGDTGSGSRGRRQVK
jgi:hypothetical protein